jgi:hypothetical protein
MKVLVNRIVEPDSVADRQQSRLAAVAVTVTTVPRGPRGTHVGKSQQQHFAPLNARLW